MCTRVRPKSANVEDAQPRAGIEHGRPTFYCAASGLSKSPTALSSGAYQSYECTPINVASVDTDSRARKIGFVLEPYSIGSIRAELARLGSKRKDSTSTS